MEKGVGLINFLNKIIPFRIVQWFMLGPNEVAVISSFGKYRKRVRRGIVRLWSWEKATILFTGQRIITVGFYGEAGRFTDIYLSWLLKSFPSEDNTPVDHQYNKWKCIPRAPVKLALKHLEKILVNNLRAQIISIRDKQPSTFKFQFIKSDQNEEFYDGLLKEPALTKPIQTDVNLDEIPKWIRKYFEFLIKQNTSIETGHIPARVWKRVLSEAEDVVQKWEEENMNLFNDKLEKSTKKKEKEYNDAEQRDPKLRYNEEFQNERIDETRKLREKLREERKYYEEELKLKRSEVEDHFHALKEIETILSYHKIKFVEDVYNSLGSESFISQNSANPNLIFIPTFSRIFGPLFTSEKIQMNMTASVFFTIVKPFKLIRNVGYERAMLVLVSKLASSLRSTISRLTLSEIFEERQKLMEMLRRELDDVADDWGIEIKSVAIEEIFLEDPAFQRILDDRREMELYGERRIEQKRTEANQLLIQGRQQAERLVMESQAEKERELNRIKQSIERSMLELETRVIEAETLVKEKEYEAERTLISTNAEVSEIELKNQALTPNILKLELIKNLPDIIEKMTNSFQTAVLTPDQYLELISGGKIYSAIEGGISKMRAEFSENDNDIFDRIEENNTNSQENSDYSNKSIAKVKKKEEIRT